MKLMSIRTIIYLFWFLCRKKYTRKSFFITVIVEENKKIKHFIASDEDNCILQP